MSGKSLVALDGAQRALATITTVAEAKDLRDKAEASGHLVAIPATAPTTPRPSPRPTSPSP